MLKLSGIEKAYRTPSGAVPVLTGLSLEIDAGSLCAILGPSGSGKSTLLNIIGLLDRPDSGQVFLDGEPAGFSSAAEAARLRNRLIGFVFQSFQLLPRLTAWENVALPLLYRNVARADRKPRALEMLDRVGLADRAEHLPNQLSGGQSQRVALARSLAKRPKLLLLDEPMGALDKKLRDRMQLEVVDILERVGVTCVMVTHDQEEAMTMASRIAVMSEGRFLQVGAPGDIYETPSSRFVADFIGNVNLMDGTLTVDEPDHVVIDSADCRHYVGHGITGTEGMAVTVALRPEKIHVSRQQPADAFNTVRGTIKEMSYFGSFTVYHLQLASGALLKVSQANVQRHKEDELTWGDEVWAHWSRSAHIVLTQ